MHERSIAVPHSGLGSRENFIRMTYLHLFAAILFFTGIEYLLFQSGIAFKLLQLVAGFNWLMILAAFMVLSWIAMRFAASSSSKPMQYFGFTIYIVLEALLFAPLLYIAEYKSGGGAIESAATATLLGFGGITALGFAFKRDFSWLGKILSICGIGAFVLIACGALFGFSLGVYFSVGMVVFAGAAILHDTSNIIHHYGEDQHVAAAMHLFSSIALMFWYVLRIFSSRD